MEIARFVEHGHSCVAYALFYGDGARLEFVTRLPLDQLEPLSDAERTAAELVAYDAERSKYPDLADVEPARRGRG